MWGGAGVGRAARRVGVGEGRLLAWGRSCRVCSLVSWFVYPFHCISFWGQFFDVGRAISVRSRLLAWLTFLIHLIPVISSISSPRLSPRPSTWMAGRFLFACRFAGRCGSVVLAAYRLAVSHHFHVSLLLPSGRFALPARRPPVFRASCLPRPRCHAVGGEVIDSSPLAPFVRYGERGSGRCLCLWRGMVSSCPHGVLSSRLVLAVGMVAALFASPSGSLSSPSRSSCRPAARFASLRYSPRPATRRAGRCLVWCRSRVGSSPVPLLAVRGAGRRVRMACYHHGSFSPWCVRACCVDYVAGAVACRSYGIFVSSIDCTYRSIGFLIWPICPLLLLSASSYRLSITLS